jgi:hypothetical protein
LPNIQQRENEIKLIGDESEELSLDILWLVRSWFEKFDPIFFLLKSDAERRIGGPAGQRS